HLLLLHRHAAVFDGRREAHVELCDPEQVRLPVLQSAQDRADGGGEDLESLFRHGPAGDYEDAGRRELAAGARAGSADRASYGVDRDAGIEWVSCPVEGVGSLDLNSEAVLLRYLQQ